jgi:U4/U6.U5 tri-snRNP-associated protein 1
VAADGEGRAKGADADMETEGAGAGASDPDDGDDDAGGKNTSWTNAQPLVQTGMAAALALLNQTGELRDRDANKAKQVGRAKDARLDVGRVVERGDAAEKFGSITLEYRDKEGNELTPKEAFRQLSYKFHGQEPGRKKKESRLKAMEERKKAEQMATGSTKLGTVTALEQQQERAKTAYVVLSGSQVAQQAQQNAPDSHGQSQGAFGGPKKRGHGQGEKEHQRKGNKKLAF